MRPFMLCFLVFLTACTNVDAPKLGVVLPKTYQNAAQNNVLDNDIRTTKKVTKWWQSLPSKTLDRHVDTLLKNNNNIQAAQARLKQAYAAYKINRAGLFPVISGSTSASRGANNFNNFRFYNNIAQAGINAQWEIDIFGRLTSNAKSALNQARAVSYDLDALKQALTAELVRRYIQAANLKAQIVVNKDILKNRKQSLKAVELRYRSGLRTANAGDVHAARVNVFSTAAQLTALEQQLLEQYYDISVLLGQPPRAIDIDFHLEELPISAPASVPSTLLDNRPDLKASALRVTATQYDLKVAVADLYPILSLSGNIGFQSEDFGSLFDASQIVSNIMASLTARLFEGGRLHANIKQQEARIQEQISDYTQNILEALDDVETALNQEKSTTKELEDRNKTLKAARFREDITTKRYQSGTENFLNVLNAQEQRSIVEQERLNTLAGLWQSRIALYLALGGNWYNQ